MRLQIDVDRVEMGGRHVGFASVVGKEVLDAPAQARAEGVSQAGAQGPAPAAVAEALTGETTRSYEEVAVAPAERDVGRAARRIDEPPVRGEAYERADRYPPVERENAGAAGAGVVKRQSRSVAVEEAPRIRLDAENEAGAKLMPVAEVHTRSQTIGIGRRSCDG